jgi:hypothetical protein
VRIGLFNSHIRTFAHPHINKSFSYFGHCPQYNRINSIVYLVKSFRAPELTGYEGLYAVQQEHSLAGVYLVKAKAVVAGGLQQFGPQSIEIIEPPGEIKRVLVLPQLLLVAQVIGVRENEYGVVGIQLGHTLLGLAGIHRHENIRHDASAPVHLSATLCSEHGAFFGFK